MSCFVVQKQHRKHYFYNGFEVRPANVGPGRSLGLRPVRAGLGRVLGRPVRTAFDIIHGIRGRNPRVLSTYNETIVNYRCLK